MYKIPIKPSENSKHRYRKGFEKQFIKSSWYCCLVSLSLKNKDCLMRWTVDGYAEPVVHEKYLEYIVQQKFLESKKTALDSRRAALRQKMKKPS